VVEEEPAGITVEACPAENLAECGIECMTLPKGLNYRGEQSTTR